ncbi:hypothetical protein Fcan01_14345 [Folsomia candida]|uniref:Uncharacterized protein n=1 Tax=Folsomia candida TaxID=158441 RepID=A0A226DYQ3_FOLCA|nr:hypothetical protein Fcan01_14345 [Folsomia candida]
MIARALTSFIKRYLSIAKWITVCPFEWEDSSHSIILRGLKHQKTVKRWLFFHLVYVIVETLLVAGKESDLRQNFRMLMFLAGNYQPTRLVTLCKLFFNLVEASMWEVPLLMATAGYLFPCDTPFLGSFLTCSFGLGRNIVFELFVFLFEFMTALAIVVATIHYSSYTLVTSILILYTECKSFLNKQFANIGESLVSFRELQILEKVVNSIIRWRLLPGVILIVPIIQILGCFETVMLLRRVKLLIQSCFSQFT